MTSFQFAIILILYLFISVSACIIAFAVGGKQLFDIILSIVVFAGIIGYIALSE